jgi:hypothetical protein
MGKENSQTSKNDEPAKTRRGRQKGASKKEIQTIEKQLHLRREFDYSKHFGKIKLKNDPLSIQKDLRNEWK